MSKDIQTQNAIMAKLENGPLSLNDLGNAFIVDRPSFYLFREAFDVLFGDGLISLDDLGNAFIVDRTTPPTRAASEITP